MKDHCTNTPFNVVTGAIAEAINRDVDIINMSIRWRTQEIDIEPGWTPSGYTYDLVFADTVAAALEAAQMRGIVTVASAGNCGNPGPESRCPATNYYQAPARYPQTIAVANADRDGRRVSSSTVNDYVDIAAPGKDVCSTAPVTNASAALTDETNDECNMTEPHRTCTPLRQDRAWDCGYVSATGTSMSTPYVSGVVAHMLNRHPDATPEQVLLALARTARRPAANDPAVAGIHDGELGWGVVQPSDAIAELGRIVSQDMSSAPLSETVQRRLERMREHNHGAAYVSIFDGSRDTQAADDVADSELVALAVFLGGFHACAIVSDHSVRCWGADVDAVNEVPTTQFSVLADGTGYHTCGILTAGTVLCWGHNVVGESEPPEGRFADVDTTRNVSCGVRLSGAVECWGHGYDAQGVPPAEHFVEVDAAGPESCGLTTSGSLVCWQQNYTDIRAAAEGPFIDFDVSGRLLCAVRTDGRLWCDGENEHGQATPPDGIFVDVASGADSACAVDANGAVQCWGQDAEGSAEPPDGPFVSINVGHSLDDMGDPAGKYYCGITTEGGINCWGHSHHGQTDPPDSIRGPDR